MLTWAFDHDDDMLTPEVLIESADSVELNLRWRPRPSRASEDTHTESRDVRLDLDIDAKSKFAPSADFMRREIEQALVKFDGPVHVVERARSSGAGADWVTFTYIIDFGLTAGAFASGIAGGLVANYITKVLDWIGRSVNDVRRGTYQTPPQTVWSERAAVYWAARFTEDEFGVAPTKLRVVTLKLDGPRAEASLTGPDGFACVTELQLNSDGAISPTYTRSYR